VNVSNLVYQTLSGLQSLPNYEWLKHLNLNSLELRWLQADLVWCYKIILVFTVQMLMIYLSWISRLTVEAYI